VDVMLSSQHFPAGAVFSDSEPLDVTGYKEKKVAAKQPLTVKAKKEYSLPPVTKPAPKGGGGMFPSI